MAEDPTRIMRPDDGYERRRPPQQKPHGNLRLVVAIMGAVIFGLFIALLVSGGGGETKTVTVTKEIEVPVEATQTESKAEKEAAEEKAAEKEAEEPTEAEEESGEAEEGETSGGVSPAELQEIEEIDRGEIENPVTGTEEGTIEELPEEGTGGGGLGTG
jgi:hypothetical protein